MNENNNNEEICILKGYRFLLQHPLKIDDVLNPDVGKLISKWVNEETKERLFLIEKKEPELPPDK